MPSWIKWETTLHTPPLLQMKILRPTCGWGRSSSQRPPLLASQLLYSRAEWVPFHRLLGLHSLPSYIPRKHHIAWACIHSRSRHSSNPQVSPYHSYLAGCEISTPSGLESPPSFTPGILPQNTQQRSVCKDPFATHTPRNCSPLSPVPPAWGKGHVPLLVPHSDGTMLSPHFQLLACLKL